MCDIVEAIVSGNYTLHGFRLPGIAAYELYCMSSYANYLAGSFKQLYNTMELQCLYANQLPMTMFMT